MVTATEETIPLPTIERLHIMKHGRLFVLALMPILGISGLITGCCSNDDYTPKPKAYLRFDFPPKAYSVYDTAALPFSFERANEARCVMKKNQSHDKWLDVLYPTRKGIMFLTYKHLGRPEELAGQIDTSYKFLEQHFNFTSGVDEERFVNPATHVYATTFHLKGSDVASTFQFYATDSLHHFLRGSIYLNQTPNNDSLAPLLEYLQHDAKHLIETLKWRE